MPGENISLHDDKLITRRENIIRRIQIYCNTTNNIEIILDDEIKDSLLFKNSIVDFDLNLTHGYRNKSTDPFYIFVFDIIN